MGGVGEKKAAKHLKKNGYKILEKNYRARFGEIDLIAERNGEIVFIEVKTRSDEEYGFASEAVNSKKQEKYRLAATEYLMRKEKTDSPCRFDVIEIIDGEINHIKDAFC